MSTSLIRRLGHLKIRIAHSNPNIHVEYSLRIIVLPSLVYPWFELDIEQDEIRIALLIKQETE